MEKKEEQLDGSIKKLKGSRRIEVISMVSWSSLTAFCGYTFVTNIELISALTLSASAFIVAANGFSIHKTNTEIKKLENEKSLIKTKKV